MNRILISGILVSALFVTSCSKKENNTVTPSTNTEYTIPYTSLSASSNYLTTFVDDQGASTVSFGGQTTRINMLKELDVYMKTGTSASLDATKMQNMFQHQNSPFSDADLNAATGKVISSKTAASFSASAADAERQRFISYFQQLATISQSNGQTAAQGQAGLLGGKRLVGADGIEYNQIIAKGLIGAMMLDQISNVYLGVEKQNVENTAKEEGENYTTMEHHWDEAYGYLTSNATYPTDGAESFLGGYAAQGTSVHDGAGNLFLAFLKGRAAIVNKDYTTRDEQIAYIRAALEKAVATVAISYLNKTNSATDDASRFHALSEGVGFIYSLRYAYAPKVSSAKSDELMNKLMNKTNGFWSLTAADINSVRDELATVYGIDKSTVVNH